MSPVVVRARAELRARLMSVIALAILAGLGAGAVMAATAGARRTDSSYRRFATNYLAADMEVYPSFGAAFASFDFNKVAALPQVIASATYRYLGTVDQRFSIIGDVPPYGIVLDRPKVISGRMPRANSLDEVAVSFDAANHANLKVGSRLTLTFDTFNPKIPPIPKTVRVVGVEASPGEFPPGLGSFGSSNAAVVHVSEALYRSVASVTGQFNALLLRFRHGSADVAAVVAELSALAKNKPHLEAILGDQAANVQRSIHTQTVALWIVGALVALIVGLVASQLLARQAVLDSNENPTLQALGMTRTQVWLTGMGRAAMIGLCGAVIGVVVAILASPLMPFGTARIAEPNPGFSFDPLVLGVGALATLSLMLSLALWPVWKNSRAIQREDSLGGTDKPTLIGRAAGLPGLSPPVATGMRLALESGRGRTEVPVRSSLMSVILAIAALASALTFSAGLTHLLATPRLYGWNWDAHLTTTTDIQDATPALNFIKSEAGIQDAALIDTPPYIVNGKVRVDGVALDQVKGLISPIVSGGRAPAREGEIALGAKTLRDLHTHIGSTVNVGIAAITGPAAPMRVVGTVVLPPNSDTARLGSGVMMTIDGEKPMIPPGVHPPPLTDILVRFASGTDKRGLVQKMQSTLGGDWAILQPTRPTDLVNFGQVQNLPLVLAGLVALLAVATLAHTLITAIRRRRRDLAILKMLGFVPRQVRWAVAWQATTFVSVSLLIGLPLGIVIGRVVWTFFADQLGALAEASYPSIALLLTIPAAIVLANVIATVPAFIAARMKPAVVLRAE